MANTTVPESHADLLEAPIATLATVGRDGRPQTSTVWFLAEDGVVRFSLHTDRQKTKNLQANPVISVHIQDQANPARYLELRGDARIEPDDDYAFAGRVGAKYGGADLRAMDGGSAGPGRRDGRADARQRRRSQRRLSSSEHVMSKWSDELALAFSLADSADTVSMSHFTSEDLTTVHKADGTPVVAGRFRDRAGDARRASSRASRRRGGRRGGRPAARRRGRGGGSSTASTARTTTRSGGPGGGRRSPSRSTARSWSALVSAPAFGRRWWAVKRRRGVDARALPPAAAFDAAAAEPIHVRRRDIARRRRASW